MSDLFMSMHRGGGGASCDSDAQRRRWHRSTAPGGSAASCTSSVGTAAGARRTRRHAATVANGDIGRGAGRDFENLLSLQLRKPAHWKWELSTSRSCTNIALPRILLYNHHGELLVDAPGGQQEQCFRQDDAVPPARRSRSDTRSGSKASAPLRPFSCAGRAATANLEHSIRKVLERELSGLHIAEATPSPTTGRSVRTTPTLNSPIEFYTNELPDHALGRRGVRRHGGGAKTQPLVVDLPTPPSTATPTTTTTASSSSGAREKRRYRRSHSSGRSPANSRSILERMSYHRGRYSSPEMEVAELQQLSSAPRYFLRSSRAGTLMLREDSFSQQAQQQQRRRRRKPKTSSSEQLASESRSPSFLRLPEAQEGGGSLQDISELPERQRARQAPIRRFRSDGNVLLQRHTPSSSELDEGEEEEEEQQERGTHKLDGNPAYNHFHSFRRAATKRDDLPAIDSGNEIASSWNRQPTRR